MPVPAGVTLVTLNIDPPVGVSPAGLRIRVDPTWPDVSWSANGQSLGTMLDAPRRGVVSVKVPAVDQNGFVNSDGQPMVGWQYVLTVEGVVAGASIRTVRVISPTVAGGALTFGVAIGEGGSASLPSYLSQGSLDGRYAPLWQANFAYAINAPVVLPNGTTGKRTAAGTSRATFDATEQAAWTVLAGSGSDSRLATAGSSDPDFSVKYDDGVAFLTATEADGITSKIKHLPQSVPEAALATALATKVNNPADARLVSLPEESGWQWVTMGTDRRVISGVRTDGTTYGFSDTAPTVTLSPLLLVGDSLTAAYGTLLAPVLGRAVVNIGIGGQGAAQIAARQGGHPALLTLPDNKIPASGAVVLTTAPDVSLLSLPGDGSSSILGVLVGIAGTLSMVQSGATRTYTFTRATSGQVMPCPPLTPFQTGFAYREHLPIICAGRNDAATATPESVVAKVQEMLTYSRRRDRALVLSIPPSTADSTDTLTKIATLNALLRDTFGSAYVDSAAYLRSADTLAAVGLTPTTTDIANIAAGLTPESFRASGDGLHYNTKAYEALNLLIAAHYSAKGWTN